MNAVLRMTAIIVTLFVAMKGLMLAATGLPRAQWPAFLLWPGMRTAPFVRRREPDPRGGWTLIGKGARHLLAGLALLVLARGVAGFQLPVPGGSPQELATAGNRQLATGNWLATIAALPALSLILHFGIFDVVAGVYRLRGIPVAELFRAPLSSRSLSEFWSRRWNVGYSEMIATLVDRPLRGRIGPSGALFASFLASGLLHELAISVPVHAGYGLPTLYFLLHGALVAVERRMPSPPGQVWTIFWLAAPLPLLFHPPFVRHVIWPLIGLKG